ncbi:thioesterase family protein [Gymnodinialimonas sp. 2305UL16-5]
MPFEFHQKVLFRHCDPAGIVFYPRYFEMMNDCLEAFFESALGTPWPDLHINAAIPTAQISTRFTAPSSHGDELLLRVAVTRVGRSSVGYLIGAHAGAEQRFETTGTLAFVNDAGKPTPWPAEIRAKLLEERELAL